MSFGKRLCWLRIQTKVPIERIARDLGLDVNAYLRYEIEEREPDDRFLALVADRYGVTTDFLLKKDGRITLRGHFPDQSEEDQEDLETYIAMMRAKRLRKSDKQNM